MFEDGNPALPDQHLRVDEGHPGTFGVLKPHAPENSDGETLIARYYVDGRNTKHGGKYLESCGYLTGRRNHCALHEKLAASFVLPTPL
jgi:hypothetical protein